MSAERPPHVDLELLSSYLDDQLPPEERTLVEGHLRDCAECTERLAGLRRSVASLRSLERVAPPAELLARVRHGVAHPRPETFAGGPLAWLRWPALRPAFAGAAVAALAAVVALAYFALGTPEAPPAPTVAERQAQRDALPAPPAVKAKPGTPAPIGSGVEGRVPGDVEGRARGGVPGGVAGGVAAGVPAGTAAPEPAAGGAPATGAPAAAPPPPAPAPLEALAVPEQEAAAPGAPREERSAQPGAAAVAPRRDQPALSLAAPAAKAATPEELVAGGRRFVRDARGWHEAGIAADAVPTSSLLVASDAGRALLARLGDLGRRLAPGDRVLLQDGGRVVELRGPAAPERR